MVRLLCYAYKLCLVNDNFRTDLSFMAKKPKTFTVEEVKEIVGDVLECISAEMESTLKDFYAKTVDPLQKILAKHKIPLN